MADRTFAGSIETLALFENEAASETFGRFHRQLPCILPQRSPQVLEMLGHVLFPNADGSRHFTGGKATRAEQIRHLAANRVPP
jgi:hypothetical protein